MELTTEYKENIKSYVWRHYKMKYAPLKRGFWLIASCQRQKYYGFIEESLLGKAINDNQTHETLLKVLENIVEKIIEKESREEQG